MANRTYWAAPLGPMNFADGTPATATSVADCSPAPQKVISPDWLELGTVVRLRARGEYTVGSTATTGTFGFYWGGAAGTALAIASAVAMTTSVTSFPWLMEWEGEIRALGTSGSIKGHGWLSVTPTTLITDSPHIPVPATAALRTVTIDTTTRKIVTVGAAVSQVTGAPSITCYGLTAEILG
jgi:hypothetical protein